jgi:hypothetical protein
LSDGDVVFQPHKVERASLSNAVDGRVLIYIHKEEALDDVERRFPAEHYAIVDDKLRILAAVKRFWGDRVTTVFVRQGAYARDPQMVGAFPPADITIERIGDLLSGDVQRLRVGWCRHPGWSRHENPTKTLHSLGQSEEPEASEGPPGAPAPQVADEIVRLLGASATVSQGAA